MNSTEAFNSIKSSHHLRVTSEERTKLLQHHHAISLAGAGQSFNREVFTYPCIFSTPFTLLVLLLACYPRKMMPEVTLGVAVLVALVALGAALTAVWKAMQENANRAMRIYFAFMLTLSVGAGYKVGEEIWRKITDPYFSYEQLKVYHNVDPKAEKGSRYADAGVVYFSSGSTILRGRNACLKNDNLYCIAPIVNCGPYGDCGPLDTSTGSFDYFAVGKDCCGCPNGEFRCGDWNNPITHGGLRLIENEDILYYKLAVKQWEASYDKSAKTPLFFHWELRPQTTARGLFPTGVYYGVLSICVFFVIQLGASFTADQLKLI